MNMDVPTAVAAARLSAKKSVEAMALTETATVTWQHAAASMNRLQRLAFDLAISMVTANSGLGDAMLMLGGPGTGKSFVINAISARCDELFGQGSVKLLAPTGTAAFNIKGETYHSVLKIGRSSILKPSPSLLKELQTTFRDVKVVIIDEVSMIGKQAPGSIDRRLRQAMMKDETSTCWGGLVVILVGDFQQLPPVLDSMVYTSPKEREAEIKLYGHNVYRSIIKVILLQESKRQDDPAFVGLLQAVASGEITKEHWQTLQQRSPLNVGNDKLSTLVDAPRLSYTRQFAMDYNTEKLLSLCDDRGAHTSHHHCVRLDAVHVGNGSATADSDKARGLAKFVYLTIGARVMITTNIRVSLGLHNGAMGYVHAIIFAPGSAPPELPVSVVVQMDNLHSADTVCPNRTGRCVHIYPLLVEIDTATRSVCTRTQIPLASCWG